MSQAKTLYLVQAVKTGFYGLSIRKPGDQRGRDKFWVHEKDFSDAFAPRMKAEDGKPLRKKSGHQITGWMKLLKIRRYDETGAYKDEAVPQKQEQEIDVPAELAAAVGLPAAPAMPSDTVI